MAIWTNKNPAPTYFRTCEVKKKPHSLGAGHIDKKICREQRKSGNPLFFLANTEVA
ncbi:MAG: hypothetical protein RRB22_12665 [Gammaproteobacteria bacterium]|nr:hypothetical protein [Gammaproteobacteria bacterium]